MRVPYPLGLCNIDSNLFETAIPLLFAVPVSKCERHFGMAGNTPESKS